MNYPGGKNGAGVYQQIINQMPPHELYIEAFLGSGAVLRNKRPAPGSIAIDLDADALIAFCDETAPPDLTVINADTISWLEGQDTFADVPARTLIYCDPPYVRTSRRSPRDIYRFEMTDEQHARLLTVLKSLDCMVMISGYWSELYAIELADWRTVTYQTMTRGGKIATEYLWMNYPQPIELHDYRFLGNNFRERERIKRRKTRWLSRLKRMEPIERYAMLDAIGEFRSAEN
jgi:site-specific DNA-adenine methylase